MAIIELLSREERLRRFNLHRKVAAIIYFITVVAKFNCKFARILCGKGSGVCVCLCVCVRVAGKSF